MNKLCVYSISQVPKNYTGFVEDVEANHSWWVNGRYHREDGPAVIWADGTKVWYKNGKEHRADGPAYEGYDGTLEWWVNGIYHREDGPAYFEPRGTRIWYLKDKMIYRMESPLGDYLTIEDGLPSTLEWLGRRVTQRKILTAEGLMVVPNLPGI